MNPNLGQLLEALNLLDQAAARAPLQRIEHVNVQAATQMLRTALPEFWKVRSAKDQMPAEKPIVPAAS